MNPETIKRRQKRRKTNVKNKAVFFTLMNVMNLFIY